MLSVVSFTNEKKEARQVNQVCCQVSVVLKGQTMPSMPRVIPSSRLKHFPQAYCLIKASFVVYRWSQVSY